MGNFCHFLNMATPVLIILAVGIFLRLSLFGTSIAEWFAGRNEVTTPLTSWNRRSAWFIARYTRFEQVKINFKVRQDRQFICGRLLEWSPCLICIHFWWTTIYLWSHWYLLLREKESHIHQPLPVREGAMWLMYTELLPEFIPTFFQLLRVSLCTKLEFHHILEISFTRWEILVFTKKWYQWFTTQSGL